VVFGRDEKLTRSLTCQIECHGAMGIMGFFSGTLPNPGLFSPLVSLNKALLGACFLGGVALGTLNSHEWLALASYRMPSFLHVKCEFSAKISAQAPL